MRILLILLLIVGCAPTESAKKSSEPMVAPVVLPAADVEVHVDANAGRRAISPYLFGRNTVSWENNGAAGLDPTFVRDVGLHMVRDSSGNNCTKYNWRTDASSHPDWYNNVYTQHLHERATKVSREYGDLQGLYSLQVLGWVAKEGGEKFNYSKNDNQPGLVVRDQHLNLCADGKIDLYLQKSTPKDTVDMLDYWFKPTTAGGLGLDQKNFRYIHLDNEPECWRSTHDDVSPTTMPASEAVDKYIAVAKEVKTRYPKLRVLAPGFSSEWFIWNWTDQKFVEGLPWMQYFVKRMGEESKKFGRPLIDVVDFHTYIDKRGSDADLLQEHRIFYDDNYQFPGANGCKRMPDGTWHEDQKVELIFGRMEKWLEEYFGKGHNIGIGITETGIGQRDPMVAALWYASMLGTFADHGVEVFTPWEWNETWWEVMHVFSRYGRENRVEAKSSNEEMVSAYASVGTDSADGMTVILVNRDKNHSHTAKLSTKNWARRAVNAKTLTLAKLPKERTFKSHTDNALQPGVAHASGDDLIVDLPPYSIVTVLVESTW